MGAETEPRNWKQKGLDLIGLALGVLFAAGLGVYSFLNGTPPLHPNPQDVPSVTHVPPLPEWADAVEAGTSRPSRWRVDKRAWSATTGSRWAGW